MHRGASRMRRDSWASSITRRSTGGSRIATRVWPTRANPCARAAAASYATTNASALEHEEQGVVMTIAVCGRCGAKNRVDERAAQARQPVCGQCGAKLNLAG